MSPDKVVWCQRGWQPVCFGFCPSETAWNREMKRFGMKEPYPVSDGRTTTFFNANKGAHFILVTIGAGGVNRSDVEITGLLVHEAMHVWQSILESIGEEKPGREMEAYAMQAITQELLQAFHATRPPRRKSKVRSGP